MLAILKNFFTAPFYEGDPEKTQDAKTVHRVALALLGLAVFALPFILLLEEPTRTFALYSSGIGLALWLFTIFLVKRGHNKPAKFIILIVNTSNLLVVIYSVGGLTRPTIYTTIFLVAMANLLFPKRGTFLYAIILLALSSTILILGINKLVPEPTIPDTELSNFYIYSFTLIASAVVLAIASANAQRNTETAQDNAQKLIARNTELSRLRTVLESRVEERTAALKKRAAQLEAVAEISQAISNIQERESQYPYITQTISEKLNYYHVAIFLLDDDQEHAVMRASSSPGGQVMLANKHKLRVGQEGIIGSVAQSGEARIALDVGEDAAYFGNPNLPETRSEIALPLLVGGKVMGVLDVQSAEEYAFFTEDTEVLRTLAGQVAAAIENARLFEETQTALNQAEQVLRQFTKEGWSQYTKTIQHKGMLFSEKEIRKLTEISESEDIQNAFKTNKLVETEETLAIPVKVRGETIGVLGFRSKSGPRKWSREELALMQSAAERSALALENARLLDDAQRRASTEHAISEISAKIGATTDIDNILKSTVQELGIQLGDTEIMLELESDQE